MIIIHMLISEIQWLSECMNFSLFHILSWQGPLSPFQCGPNIECWINPLWWKHLCILTFSRTESVGLNKFRQKSHWARGYIQDIYRITSSYVSSWVMFNKSFRSIYCIPNKFHLSVKGNRMMVNVILLTNDSMTAIELLQVIHWNVAHDKFLRAFLLYSLPE